MNTSIVGDKLVVVWQVIVLVLATCLWLGVAPYLIGRKFRRHNTETPRLLRRLSAAFLIGVVSLVLTVVGVGVVTVGLERVVPETVIDIGVCLVFLLSPLICLFLLKCIYRRAFASARTLFVGTATAIGVAVVAFWMMGAVSLGRMRMLELRSIDAAQMRAISTGLAVYSGENGAFPQDLRQLGMADHNLVSSAWLHCTRPSEPSSADSDVGNFIYYPRAFELGEDLIGVWEDPKCNEGEGGFVVLTNGAVRWLSSEELWQQVARTQAKLKEIAATRPHRVTSASSNSSASSPAGS